MVKGKYQGAENGRVAGVAGSTWGRRQGQGNVGRSRGAASIWGFWLGAVGHVGEGGWRRPVLRRLGLYGSLQVTQTGFVNGLRWDVREMRSRGQLPDLA